MTRKEDIDNLSLKFYPIINDINNQINDLNQKLTMAQSQYSDFVIQINEYYDALDRKDSIDQIIARGLPDNAQVDTAVTGISIKVNN